MATIEDAIYQRLANDAAVSAVVGTRIVELKLPDNPTLPALTFEQTLGEVAEDFDDDIDAETAVISVHCWARTQAEVRTLARKVRAALYGSGWTYSDREVKKVREWSQTSLYDTDTDIYHVSCSCRVWYY